SPLWSTINVEVNIVQGVYSVELGDAANPIDPSILVGDTAYLQVTVDDQDLSPRMKINSVGYAIQAGGISSSGAAAITANGNISLMGGNVGIGTTAPEQKLDVNGRLVISDTLYFDGVYGTHDWHIDGQTDGPMRFVETGEDTRMVIDSGGNVGIGDADPSTELEVAGTVSANAFVGDGSGLTGVASTDTGWDHTASENIDLNGNLLVGTGGSAGVFVKSDGNVGIGTTDPGADLDIETTGTPGGVLRLGNNGDPVIDIGDVAGKIEFYNEDATYGAGVQAYIQSRAVNAGADYALDFYTGDITPVHGMTIAHDGDVGIGTTAPISLLEVKAADTVTGAITIGGGKATVTSIGEINSQLDFRSNDASVNNINNIGGRIASITEHTNGAYVGLAFYTFQQSRSPDLKEAMRINNSGNVGIGTTDPGVELHVGAVSPTLMLEADGTGDDPKIRLARNGSASNVEGQIWLDNSQGQMYFDNLYNNNAGNIFFRTKVSGTTVNALTIEGSGNVGIGTTAIANAGSWGSLLQVADDTNAAISVHDTDGGKQFEYGVSGDKLFMAYDTDAVQHRMVVDTAGNVGIGTVDPGAKLEVAGTVSASAFIKDGAALQEGKWDGSGNINYMGGNVGIGTTAPGVDLHVHRESSDSDLQISRGDNSGDFVAQVLSEGGYFRAKDSSGTSQIMFRSYGNSYINTGNVGIGTTAPDALLEISGSDANLTIAYTGSDVSQDDIQSVVYLSGKWRDITAPGADDYTDGAIKLFKDAADGSGGAGLSFWTSLP
ncbi:hypothetical protein ACFL57_05750, partial [Candidatus Margulisiibacteriota bacterium]